MLGQHKTSDQLNVRKTVRVYLTNQSLEQGRGIILIDVNHPDSETFIARSDSIGSHLLASVPFTQGVNYSRRFRPSLVTRPGSKEPPMLLLKLPEAVGHMRGLHSITNSHPQAKWCFL